MNRSTFRALVAAYVATNVLGAYLAAATRSQLPEALQPFADPATVASSPVLQVSGLVLFCLAIATAVGLLLFWRPARELYLVYLVLTTLVGFTMPPIAMSGLAATVLTTNATLSGAVAAAILFSPIAHEFERKDA